MIVHLIKNSLIIDVNVRFLERKSRFIKIDEIDVETHQTDETTKLKEQIRKGMCLP